jgi:hypothetical protein
MGWCEGIAARWQVEYYVDMCILIVGDRHWNWPCRSKRTKNNAKLGLSRNSAVGRQRGTLIPGRVLGRLSGPFQWESVALGRSSEIVRLWDQDLRPA